MQTDSHPTSASVPILVVNNFSKAKNLMPALIPTVTPHYNKQKDATKAI